MIRHLIHVAGIITTLTLLLASVAAPACAHQATTDQCSTAPVSNEPEQAEDTVLICLALVGGAALLAGGVWIGRLRRMLP